LEIGLRFWRSGLDHGLRFWICLAIHRPGICWLVLAVGSLRPIPWTLSRHGCYVASISRYGRQDNPDLCVMNDFKPLTLLARMSVISDRVSIACYTRPNVIVVVCTRVPLVGARNKLRRVRFPYRTLYALLERPRDFRLVELQTD